MINKNLFIQMFCFLATGFTACGQGEKNSNDQQIGDIYYDLAEMDSAELDDAGIKEIQDDEKIQDVVKEDADTAVSDNKDIAKDTEYDAKDIADEFSSDAAESSDFHEGTDVQPEYYDVPDLGEIPQNTCEKEISALASEMYKTIGSCTSVVRLDYQTMKIIAFQLICGKYNKVSLETAAETSLKDTGYGGTLLNKNDQEDFFIFYMSPGDFGGTGVVSGHTGLSVFGGSIIWMGTGQITYPKTWRDPDELGSGCPEIKTDKPVKGYDLSMEVSPSEDTYKNAAKVVFKTALPEAIYYGGYLFDVTVLLYPRTVGMFYPGNAEWIVLLNSGWLE
jgi:hypothetical protein